MTKKPKYLWSYFCDASLPQLAEKDFNPHVDKMTHSVNTCQLLSLPPLLLPNGLMSKSDSRSRDRCYIWPQQHGFLLTKAELAMATTKCLVFQHQRLTLSSWHSTTPLGDQPGGRLITMDCFLCGRGNIYWNIHLLWIRICLFCTQTSAQTTIHELRVLYPLSWYYTQNCI